VRIRNWFQRSGDQLEPLPNILPHWDTGTPLHIVASCELDLAAIREECRLPSTATVRLGLTWYSQGTTLRGSGDFYDLNLLPETESSDLELFVDGTKLANRISLEVRLVLLRAPDDSPVFAAHRPGSVLWSTQKEVILEGTGSRFPVELVDFGNVPPLPPDAAWFLDWDANDPEQMALGNLRLLVNTRHKRISNAITTLAPADQPLVEAIKYDVARSMINSALMAEGYHRPPADYAEGTVGSAISRLLLALFPAYTFDGIRNLQKQNPTLFDCRLQESLRLFQED
jgi:hypothetical protein